MSLSCFFGDKFGHCASFLGFGFIQLFDELRAEIVREISRSLRFLWFILQFIRGGGLPVIEVLVGRGRPVKQMISNFKLSRVSETSNTGCQCSLVRRLSFCGFSSNPPCFLSMWCNIETYRLRWKFKTENSQCCVILTDCKPLRVQSSLKS